MPTTYPLDTRTLQETRWQCAVAPGLRLRLHRGVALAPLVVGYVQADGSHDDAEEGHLPERAPAAVGFAGAGFVTACHPLGGAMEV